MEPDGPCTAIVAASDSLPSMSTASASADAETPDDKTTYRRLGQRFISTDPLGNALIYRQLLETHYKIVTAHMDMHSIRSEKKANIAAAKSIGAGGVGGNRPYPLSDCALQKIEEKFKSHWRLLFCYGQLWDNLIPNRSKTVTTRGLASRVLSKYEAMVQGSLVGRHRRYPTKLFRKVEADDVDDELENESLCFLGPFVWSIVQPYRNGQLGGFKGLQFKYVIIVQAKTIRAHNGKLECWHAMVRRFLEVRGVQTKRMELENASAEGVLHRLRKRSEMQHMLLGPDLQQPLGGPQTALADEPTEAPHKQRATSDWNLFAKEETQGKGAFNMRDVSLKWKALSPDDREKLSARRNELVKASVAKGSTSELGPNKLERRVMARTRRFQATMQPTSDELALVDTSAVHEDRHAVVQRLVDATIKQSGLRPLTEIVTAAKAVNYRLSRQEKQQELVDERLLREWTVLAKPETFANLSGTIPFDDSLAQMFIPSPMSSGGASCRFEPHCTTAISLLRPILSMTAHKSNLREGMALDWMKKHEKICLDECPPIVDETKTKTTEGVGDDKPEQPLPPWKRLKPPCWKVGFHMCNEVGDLITHARYRFYNLMSSTMPPKSTERTLKMDGNIVLELNGKRAVSDDPMELALAELLGNPVTGVDVKVFWHVCHYNLSPREIYARVLTPNSDQPIQLSFNSRCLRNVYFWICFHF